MEKFTITVTGFVRYNKMGPEEFKQVFDFVSVEELLVKHKTDKIKNFYKMPFTFIRSDITGEMLGVFHNKLESDTGFHHDFYKASASADQTTNVTIGQYVQDALMKELQQRGFATAEARFIGLEFGKYPNVFIVRPDKKTNRIRFNSSTSGFWSALFSPAQTTISYEGLANAKAVQSDHDERLRVRNERPFNFILEALGVKFYGRIPCLEKRISETATMADLVDIPVFCSKFEEFVFRKLYGRIIGEEAKEILGKNVIDEDSSARLERMHRAKFPHVKFYYFDDSAK